MSSGVVDNERPPYLSFFYKAVEDRAESIKQGHYVTKDVAFVKVTRPGARDTSEFEVDTWLKSVAANVAAGRCPNTWLGSFERAFKAWKSGEELPVDGTPLKTWPVLSPAQRENAIHNAGFRTVEDLAAAPDNTLDRLGIGGLNLKQKAIAWLAAARDKGALAEEVSALKTENASLKSALEELQATVQKLVAAKSGERKGKGDEWAP